jgi:magnesium transporter
MIVDCAVYTDGRRNPGQLDVADAFEAGREPNAFVWIGLHDPTSEEFAAVQNELELHPLAVEDALTAQQQAKLEQYDETVFAVVKTALYDDEAETVSTDEIHMFAGENFVVTVRHGGANELSSVRRTLERDADTMRRGPIAVVHAVFDSAVDHYQQVIEQIEIDLDELENEVFSADRPNVTERIFRLKRQVLDFHRAITPLDEPLLRLTRQQVPSFCCHPEMTEYFRDVLDHNRRTEARIESARDTLTSALNANLAQISVRQNEDMRAMSGWAAVIAVPTLIAGVWGMNFQHMPELRPVFAYPFALGTIVGSGLLVRWKLRRNGWIE